MMQVCDCGDLLKKYKEIINSKPNIRNNLFHFLKYITNNNYSKRPEKIFEIEILNIVVEICYINNENCKSYLFNEIIKLCNDMYI